MVFENQAFYAGVYRHNLDAKGRLTIPSKWRFQGDEADIYLGLPNPAGFISVFPPKRIRELEEKLRSIKITDLEGQQRMTAFLSMTQKFGCDGAGRINLNEDLIDHAGIAKGAVLVGAMSWFNIYSAEVYDALMPKTREDKAALFKDFDF